MLVCFTFLLLVVSVEMVKQNELSLLNASQIISIIFNFIRFKLVLNLFAIYVFLTIVIVRIGARIFL